MAEPVESLEGGFAEPVFGAQATFRALMQGMSRPGSPIKVTHEMAPPTPLAIATGAISYTLADQDTPVWIDTQLSAHGAARTWLAFHTGAPITTRTSEAVLALVTDAAGMPRLDEFSQGSQDYPDRSTTVIVQVESLDGGEEVIFEGPGIEKSVLVAPRGLPASFAEQLAENRSRFPRGVDLILVAGDVLLCLPRSARLVRSEG